MIKTAIQTLEENSKADLLSIHENMNGLIERADLISIDIDDVESYEDAVNLKRVIKSTHVAIEKKRKELKAPIIDAGKRLDDFAKSIYQPLKEAEELLKSKMLPFEENQERIKEEQRLSKEKEEKAKEELNEKLMKLNSTLQRINSCQTKKEVSEIESYLDSINPKDFGERSDEAGFIISNMKMTCSMIKKSLPDDTQEVIIENHKMVKEINPVNFTDAFIVPEQNDGFSSTEQSEETLEFDFSEVSTIIKESANSPLMVAMEKAEKLRNRISDIDSQIQKLEAEKIAINSELENLLIGIQK